MNRRVESLAISTALAIAIGNTYISSIRYNKAINEMNQLNTKIEEQQLEINDTKIAYEDAINKNKTLESQLSETTEELENARQNIAKYTKITEFDEFNLTELSQATELHMKHALTGTALEKVAGTFVRAEETYGVNAYFLAAIAAQESSWGTSDRAKYQNNLTGHAVYDNGSKGSTFSSWSDSILETARLLKEEYLTPSGKYFNGFSTVNVNANYCFYQDRKTVDYNWSISVNSIAKSLQHKANIWCTRYTN